MSNLVNRNKNNLFKKRHYVSIIKSTVSFLTRYFGYRQKPFLFESINKEGEAMFICRGRKGHYAIFYDYMQFKKVFGHLDFDVQEAYAMLLIAHEMRHYYQMRQIDSPHPTESKDRIAMWRRDDENPKYPGEDCSILEFYMQPMELDAELFAYVFVADKLDALVNLDYIDKAYINELEKYYVEIFGKTNEELFPREEKDGS